ncbi:MAG: SusD/RagB family nutrient-binding outer membrane lipoprotein [Sphingobacteriales bacterium]
MKKYILLIAVFFTIGVASCKKDFLSQEVNPNSPSVTTPQLTLAGALATTAAIVNGGDYSNFGVWVQYWTNSGNYVPNAALDAFQINNTSFTQPWIDLYQNLTNYNSLQTTSAAVPADANFRAIAMIMKAYDFEQLVDQFGDVPYSQAFQPSTILFPAYDSGQAIYNDLVKQLDAAIALINSSGSATNPGVSDIVFGGNMVGWKKFANSIKLRLAIRQSNLGTNAAATDLAATSAEGYLDGNLDAEANPGYANLAGKQSPFWANYGVDANGNATFPNVYYRGNKFFINKLNSFNDPRTTSIYYGTSGSLGLTIAGNTFGDPQGSPTVQSNPGTSAVGPGLLISASQNAILFSGAESLFLQAEALLKGYSIGTPFPSAQKAYEAAITASFVAMKAGSVTTYDGNGNPTTTAYASNATSAALAVTYYSQAIPNVGWAASPNQLEAIIYQKWIALDGYNVLEPYLEYERTGFPILPNPVSIDPTALSTTLPVRQFYPQEELNTNAANLAKEGTINIFTTKIFWAK